MKSLERNGALKIYFIRNRSFEDCIKYSIDELLVGQYKRAVIEKGRQ